MEILKVLMQVWLKKTDISKNAWDEYMKLKYIKSNKVWKVHLKMEYDVLRACLFFETFYLVAFLHH